MGPFIKVVAHTTVLIKFGFDVLSITRVGLMSAPVAQFKQGFQSFWRLKAPSQTRSCVLATDLTADHGDVSVIPSSN
jgi:hypothetical protein